MRKTFESIFEPVTIENKDAPMVKKGFEPELDLWNPYSKITCFIVYLYSLEYGNPPLYAEANRAARDMDLTLVKELGPFLKALSEITFRAEQNKKPQDKYKLTGLDVFQNPSNNGAVEYNIAGSFLEFRGCAMRPEWMSEFYGFEGKE